jgi:subtilase family serine protease
VRLHHRLVPLIAAAALAACSGNAAPLVPAGAPGAPPATRLRPNEGAGALPGEGANALPGASLPCGFSATQGQASCTIAINLNAPPIASATTPSSLVPGLHPADLQNAYGFAAAGAASTVAIVDAYDDPSAESDLNVYRTTFGLPPCTTANGCFKKVDQRGGTTYPVVNAAWSDETALDVDMVSAICPNCKILLVEADSASLADLGAAVDQAVALGSRIVSNSYYAYEWPGETAEDVHYRHPGVAITVSSGDAAEPFYPAASPLVTSVGGTTLQGSDGAWTQSAWPHGGRGCSAYEARPRYQAHTGCSTRATVDVAIDADPQTGVATYATSAGGWIVAGGTSVGAPVVAAAYALAANPQGPAYSYAHRSAFVALSPGPYDAATGLGVPRGTAGF